MLSTKHSERMQTMSNPIYSSLKYTHRVTSTEELFELSKQPELNCSYIDEQIKQLNVDIRYALSDVEYLDVDKEVKRDLSSSIKDFENYEDTMNELRNRIEEIRAWGKEWKDLAKSMFLDLPEHIKENYIKRI